jgi:hypothetical protein
LPQRDAPDYQIICDKEHLSTVHSICVVHATAAAAC